MLIVFDTTSSLIPTEPITLDNLDAHFNKVVAHKATHVILTPAVLDLLDQGSPYDDYFETPIPPTVIVLGGPVKKALLTRLEARFKIKIIATEGYSESPENTTKSDLMNNIIAVAAEVFCLPAETLSPHSKPVAVLAWDSLGHIRLIEATERHFNIHFGLQDIMRIASLKDLHDRTQVLLNE